MRILEVFNNSLNILREHQLSEDDNEVEVNGDMAELLDELGFHSEEELNEWVDELGFSEYSDDQDNANNFDDLDNNELEDFDEPFIYELNDELDYI